MGSHCGRSLGSGTRHAMCARSRHRQRDTLAQREAAQAILDGADTANQDGPSKRREAQVSIRADGSGESPETPGRQRYS